MATLHTGFQFGWNVHTLAYTLMCLVIASGIFGVYAYLRYPQQMTDNRRGQTLREILTQIAELDLKARETSATLGDDIHSAVMAAQEKLRFGGSTWRMLAGRDPNCPAHAVLNRVGDLTLGLPVSDAEKGRALLALLARKTEGWRIACGGAT